MFIEGFGINLVSLFILVQKILTNIRPGMILILVGRLPEQFLLIRVKNLGLNSQNYLQTSYDNHFKMEALSQEGQGQRKPT